MPDTTTRAVPRTPAAARRDEAARRVEGWLAAERGRVCHRDDAGRIAAVVERDGGECRYTYDRRGDLVAIDEPNGSQVRYAYDERRRLVQVDDPDGRRASYRYDARDRLVQVDERGVVSCFAYDESGRVVEVRRGGAGALVYRYDAEGRLAEARTPSVSTRQVFDGDRIAAVCQEVDGVPLEVRLAYDGDGRLARMALPGGCEIRYTWDARGRPRSVALGEQEIARFEYADEQKLARLRLANGVVEESWADPVDCRPLARCVLRGGQTLFWRAYRYSPAGQVVADGERRYTYDSLGRLAGAEDMETGARWRYRYDERDNRVEAEDDGLRRFAYDAAGRLTRIDGPGGSAALDYDRHGRPVRVVGADPWSYRYDDAGRLVQALRNGATVARFTYDHKDRLVLARFAGRAERYLYGPDDELLAVTDEAGQPLRRYVRTPLGVLAELHGDGALVFLHHDARGACHLTTDAAGGVTPLRYDPFGAPLGEGGALPIFGGRPWVAEVGMYYFGARWYDPRLGRFLTPDSFTAAPDDERLMHPALPATRQSLARAELLGAWLQRPRLRNRYVYCGNDPLNRADPTGHWSFGGVLLSLLGAIWALPNTMFGLLLEITCLVGEVVRWLVWLISFGHVSWETPGFDVAASGRLNAFALVFSGGWFGSFPGLLGFTFGNVFFVYKKWDENPVFGGPGEVFPPAYGGAVAIPRRRSLYEHELRHANQAGWFGPLFHLAPLMLGVYEWDLIINGYEHAWLERDARARSEEPSPALASAPPFAAAAARAAAPRDAAPAPRVLAPAPAQAAPASAPAAPVLPQIAIARAVGRSSPNRAADVRLVQDRLLALRYLSQQDHAREAPPAGATGPVAEGQLAATIAAIELLEREALGAAAPGGQVRPARRVLAALNRAIPRPTAAEYAAVAAARNGIAETATRGVPLGGPVGNAPAAAVAAGQANRPADVTAVQRRLVQLGYLAAAHGEDPPAGGTAAIPAASLPRTRAAIRSFQQREVDFWRRRGDVAGAVTPEVAAPNDATGRLLDRITSYRERFASGEDISFRDYPRSPYTRHARGTSVTGTAAPSALPAADYAAVGLTPSQTSALRFVSASEGNFDALNTYDRARVSFGFIQFAGGRGLPPMMALLKSRRPVVFRDMFQAFGLDVEFNVVNGAIASAALVTLDPAASRVLRGVAAETAIRDSARLSAVFIRAGRNAAVQLVQVEAATRDYVLSSLPVQASYTADIVEELAAPGGAVTATYAGASARDFRARPAYSSLRAAGRIRERRATTTARVDAVLTSEEGLAVLMDRAIQDGAGAGRGVNQVTGAMLWVADRQGLGDIAGVARHQRLVVQQVIDDFAADAAIAPEVAAALTALAALKRAAALATATVAGVLAQAEAAAARQALDRAIALVPRKSLTRDRARLTTVLTAERARLNFAPPPATIAALRTLLAAIIAQLSADGVKLDAANAEAKRKRVQKILTHYATPGTPPP